jgi:transposase
MSMRKNIANSLKIQILRSYLKGEKSIAQLAEMHSIKPSQIYNWEKQFFDNGERAFDRKNCRMNGETAVGKINKKVEELQSKLARKDAVIGSLMEELILEKKLGGV